MDLQRICRLRGAIQGYAWGSRTALAELLGEPSPSREPQAELWLGAHPRGPACVEIDGAWVPLPDAIAAAPEEILGPAAARRFGRELPFLVKVLAAEQPLSIQAHPDPAQAAAGFARENALGIPLDAPERSYRDARHKPELLCALAPFRALCGFRPIERVLALFEALGVPELADALDELRGADEALGVQRFFTRFLALAPAARKRLLAAAVPGAQRLRGCDPAYGWVAALAQAYPGDVGALAPLFLNRVELAPGEAIFLAAGELHSYLGGVGLEVMANSDNVLRGGLTPKHVDEAELLRTLTFRSGEPAILRPARVGPGERRYPTVVPEFELVELRLESGSRRIRGGPRGPDVLLCLEGELQVTGPNAVALRRGEAALAPACVAEYAVGGGGFAYRVSVPVP